MQDERDGGIPLEHCFVNFYFVNFLGSTWPLLITKPAPSRTLHWTLLMRVLVMGECPPSPAPGGEGRGERGGGDRNRRDDGKARKRRAQTGIQAQVQQGGGTQSHGSDARRGSAVVVGSRRATHQPSPHYQPSSRCTLPMRYSSEFTELDGG